MIKSVLIANRGEIAVRVIRACAEAGIESIAVYSTADEDSMHVQIADRAICIGPPTPSESYLSIPSIISAAEVSGADAIHPGYGFLAENATLAEVCVNHGIVFVGPTAETIESFGNKSIAKNMAQNAGVPTVPGSEGALDAPEDAAEIADRIGFPVVVKASAGGGGRGMRVVQSAKDLKDSVAAAMAEAKHAFGNGDVYLEKYLEEPRHVEIQILGDTHGNRIHLGERDCSIQRRHQKLLEESPSPALDDSLRLKMGEAALKLAEAANYVGAGTVEFLLDRTGEFYFIELNARVQVEHPVTEMVTGVDVVRQQLRIADGEVLGISQDDVRMNGHAIEFRINAEDPDMDFMPEAGTIAMYSPPGGPGVRVDSHLYTGYTVPPNYDSLLGKLIVWAPNREEAMNRGERALKEFVVGGIKTTIPFHLKVLNNAFFRKGDVYTNFIARRLLSE